MLALSLTSVAPLPERFFREGWNDAQRGFFLSQLRASCPASRQWKHSFFSCSFFTLASGSSLASVAHSAVEWKLSQIPHRVVDCVMGGLFSTLLA